jgi:hypothetical protein
MGACPLGWKSAASRFRKIHRIISTQTINRFSGDTNCFRCTEYCHCALVGVARTCGRDPADVPNLEEEERALAVDGVDDGLPRLDLLLRPDAGGLRVPLRRGGDVRGLRDEQATLGGALRVVQGRVRLRHVAVGAAPRQGRQHHSVRELERPHLVRGQQRDHLVMHHLLPESLDRSVVGNERGADA